ncbi:MAG: TonB-dependent receptor [Bryobacterales bacterium]|nr:TonB-dependent receptor [Bryobacterales bacterium]
MFGPWTQQGLTFREFPIEPFWEAKLTSNLFASFRGGSRITFACLVLFVLVCGLAMGQETTGSITGQVIDSSGSAIPNAKVEVGGASLPRAMSTTTDSSGNFNFQSLPGGTYVVSATATGFSTQKTTGVSVTLGRASRLEFKMEVGQITESVVVSADAALVDTASSSSSVNVDKSFFDLMPKGRGFYDLINLAPGARNEGKSGGYQVDGASGSENTFYLDGMEVTNIQTGVLSDQNKIPVEMVQQVQVKNGVMEAQYGGAMGGVINASIRSGSNEFHGQGGIYFNNDNMSARLRPTLEMDPTDATRLKSRYFQNTLDDYKTMEPDLYHWRPDDQEQAVLLQQLHADQHADQPEGDVPFEQPDWRLYQEDPPAVPHEQG